MTSGETTMESNEPNRFDELTRVLAAPTSRRQALKAFAATAVGALFGGAWIEAGSGQALAGTCNPNNVCSSYCNATFGGNTTASAQCASDAAHCKGACYTCGPKSPGGKKTTCCNRNTSGYCATYSTQPCCLASGTGCLNN